jgi:hypothetical protein
MEFWDILESIFHWVVVIPVTILGSLIFFALIILILAGCVFNLFFKENPEKIVNLQIKKLQKVTGMSLPPYTLTAHEKMKDYLLGTIHIKFNEFLNEELLEELNKHIKNGDALRLCADGKWIIWTTLRLHRNEHTMSLLYRPKSSRRKGGFSIYDCRNEEPWDIKDLTSFDRVGGFGVFGSKRPLQESEKTTLEKPKEISKPT